MSEQTKRPPGVAVHVIKATAPVQKAETATHISQEASTGASEWIEPPRELRGLKVLVTESSILPQCIRAYKNNIAGFGIGVRYKEDAEETPEMAAEYERAEEIIELLNMDMDTKEIFEDVIEARETYGIAYLEVVRNLAGEVTMVEFIKETPTVRKTKPLEPYVDAVYNFKGRKETRPRKFCKYRQTVNGKVVYFKEIGDPRIMDKTTGRYLTGGEGEDAGPDAEQEAIPIERQANEILEFAIGTETYGEVRWIGQTLGVDGSRKAETLNNRYFTEGRHTPLLIMVKGGTLTNDSFAKLQDYMNGIKGEAGQHAFMILETESTDNRAQFDETKAPEIEVVPLASILQQDELFQNYLDNNRRKAQSAFQLPDLYVGYTTDFNRATAQTAQEVTEKQVFQPERRSLAWAINNKLLNGYDFKYVECYFKEPDITNPDDLAKILTVCNLAGGLTPNKAKAIAYSLMGETAEDYEDEWGETPLQYLKSIPASATTNFSQEALSELGLQLAQQIQKAEASKDDAVVAVMKEVRALVQKMQEEATA